MTTSKLKKFIELESASAILLLVAAVLAIIASNIPISAGIYAAFLKAPVEVKLGALYLKKNVLLLINDGLMAIFFTLIALEIKREFVDGELSSRSAALFPCFAALGGVLCPAVIYVFLNSGDAAALHGWAIPTATDIAFSLGALSLFGNRVPISLKVFLTTVAVVDDLIAIIIIAVFYTANLSWLSLGLAVCGVIILLALNLTGVSSLIAYCLVGTILWVCVLKSGVHATLAGVILGLTIPYRSSTGSKESLALTLEHKLHPWVAFLILPLFAFANSGITLPSFSAAGLGSPLTLGIALGLILGKPLGILCAAVILIKTRLAVLPNGSNWLMFAGLSCLAGIGFTMSLFIGELAFEGLNGNLSGQVKTGVFLGSIVSAVCGAALIRLALKNGIHSNSRALI